MTFFFKGLLIGFLIAAPVGPIGAHCIRQTLQYGRKSGFISGLGAATADALYGAIAAFGLTVISDFLIEQQFWLRFIGGLFLLYLGIKTFLSKIASRPITSSKKKHFGDFSTTFFLTLTNPLTILSFVAVFAGLGLGEQGQSFTTPLLIVTGIYLGSAVWWLLLSEGITLLRTRISHKAFQWINRCAGLLIITFGVIALLSLNSL